MKRIYLVLIVIFLVGCSQPSTIDEPLIIEFSSSGGSHIPTIEGNVGNQIPLPIPIREGYNFLYWYDQQNTIYQDFVILESNLRLYAKWERKTFTITFWDNNDLIDTIEFEYGTLVQAPSPPLKPGYVFNVWDKSYRGVWENLDVYATYLEATDGLVYALNEDETQYSITSYIGNETSITIPSHYFGKPITTIGFQAFMNHDTIINITLPATITTIKQQSFYNCSALEMINLSGVTNEIGEEAFYNCIALIDITLSAHTVGSSAFYGCTGIKNMTLNNSIHTIKSLAFYGNNGLTSLTIPSSVIVIEYGIINWCRNLKHIYIPNSDLERITNLFTTATYIYASPTFVGID